MHFLRPISLLLAVVPVAASAAPVTVQVFGANGAPLAGAVVQVTMPGTPAPVPRGTYTLDQRNISFQPHVLVVPVGATVRFVNSDRVRHHVYSFSRAKKFELKLFGREDDRTVTFDKPGAVALGCNIHDSMNGVIYVTTSPYVAITGADGRAVIGTAAPGRASVAVWHPSIRAPDNQMQQPAAIGPAGSSVTVRLPR